MSQTFKINLAWLYFTRHRRRYSFLIVSLVLGFAVITVMTSLSSGMKKSVNTASMNHYGGELILIGYDKDHGNRMRISKNDMPQIEEALSESTLPTSHIFSRINYYRDGILYFSGNGVRQKNILGVDWTSEADNLAAMNMVKGDSESFNQPRTILISQLTADNMGCQLGDDLVVKVNTLTGQINTGTFVVRGIFKDSSIFGAYKSFIGLKEFNQLLNYGEQEISSLGLFFDRTPSEKSIEHLYNLLSSKIPMAPLIRTKEQLTINLDRRQWAGIRYFLIPLGVYISQVDDLILAMDIVSYFLYIMIALIILLSTSVTYRLILKERAKEIGTMRAIGFQRRDMVEILLWEALFLFVISLFLGGLTSALLFEVVKYLPLSNIPAFDIFLTGGVLLPAFSPALILFNIGLMMAITLPSVLLPSLKTATHALKEIQ